MSTYDLSKYDPTNPEHRVVVLRVRDEAANAAMYAENEYGQGYGNPPSFYWALIDACNAWLAVP